MPIILARKLRMVRKLQTGLEQSSYQNIRTCAGQGLSKVARGLR